MFYKFVGLHVSEKALKITNKQFFKNPVLLTFKQKGLC